MGRNRSINTYKSVRNKIQRGYGRGQGILYKPWLNGHEFASKGVYTRMNGLTIPRMYVFLSRLEADLFVYYDTDPEVTDILEQYYMDLPTTLQLSDTLGIKHPWVDQYYNVMTADLLFQKGGKWHVRSVKTSTDLDDPRTIEKLRIEKAYFDQEKIEWKLVTEKEINRFKVQNLLWLYYEPQLDALVSSDLLIDKAKALFYKMYVLDRIPVPIVIDYVESSYNLPVGAGMATLKALIRSGEIPVNLEGPIDRMDPMAMQRKEVANERYLSYGKSGR